MTMLGPQAITMEHRQRRQLEGETAMDWKEQLRSWVDGSERQRKDIAASWHARAEEAGIRVPRVGTVVSYLSKCLAGDKDGVSCFFKDRARADLLFEELAVDGAARDGVFEAARNFLETGGAEAPRLVVDVSPWSEARQDVLFQALRRALIDDGVLRPVAVVVAESQWDSVPRSLDEKVTVVRVPDAAHAKEKVVELAGDAALVAAPWSFEDEDRSLAIELDDKAMSLAMPDALAYYEREGRLPSPPVPEHPLSAVFSEQVEPDERLLQRYTRGSPIKRSWLRYVLGDEPAITKHGWSMRDRATLSAMLGVKATSTERERIEHDVARWQSEVGVEAKPATVDELERIRERARRRPLGRVFLRVGDELHLINSPERIFEVDNTSRLRVETIPCVPSAMARLREHIRDWTIDDAENDPFLDAALEALDPEERERDLFLHARACILHGGYIQPKAPTISTDWRTALSVVLAGDPPPSSLRLVWPWPSDRGVTGVGSGVVRFVAPSGHCPSPNEGEGSVALDCPPPCVRSFVWQRSEDVDVVVLTWGNWAAHRRDRSRRHWMTSAEEEEEVPEVVLVGDRSVVEDDGAWIDLIDASASVGGGKADIKGLMSKYGNRLIVDEVLSTREREIMVPATIWDRADHYVAMSWLVLRRALASGESVPLPLARGVFLDVGGGHLAQVIARRHGAPEGPVRASVVGLPNVDLDPSSYSEYDRVVMGVDRMMVTHEATTAGVVTRFGHLMPKGIRLDGGGWRIDVEFSYWPPMATAANPVPMASVPSVGAHQLREEERRRQEEEDASDYDYDD